MLDQHTVFEHGDLGEFAALPHHHGAGDGFPTGEELGFGDQRCSAAAGLATLLAALFLGLDPGRPLQGRDFVLGLPARTGVVATATTASAASPATAADRAALLVIGL